MPRKKLKNMTVQIQRGVFSKRMWFFLWQSLRVSNEHRTNTFRWLNCYKSTQNRDLQCLSYLPISLLSGLSLHQGSYFLCSVTLHSLLPEPFLACSLFILFLFFFFYVKKIIFMLPAPLPFLIPLIVYFLANLAPFSPLNKTSCRPSGLY